MPKMRDESGAVAIVAALTLIVLLLSAAMVLDIAWLRADRVESKAGADFAATAAAASYDPVIGGTAVDGCLAALSYVSQNLYEAADTLTAVTPCNDLAVFGSPMYVCDASTSPRVAVYENSTYRVEIVSPVPDASETSTIAALGFDLMDGYAQDVAIDGDRCDRFGVRITRQRGFILGGLAGSPSGQTTQSSVARWRAGGDDPLYASVVILDAEGCGVLRNSGNTLGHLIVTSATITHDDGTTEEMAGTITVDAMPTSSCTGGGAWHNRLIAVQDNGQALVRASGRIFSHALQQGVAIPRVYENGIVSNDPAATSGLYPRPVAGPAVTREAVDHLVNCLDPYPTDQRWSPEWTGAVSLPVAACDTVAGPPPYLKNLHDRLKPSVLTPAQAAATGWAIFPDYVAGADCTSAAGTYGAATDPVTDLVLPAAVDPASVDTTRWFIDCPNSTGQAFRPNPGIHFQDVRYVVSRNFVRLNGGPLSVVGDVDDGAVFFVQNDSIARTSSAARVKFLNTFVYLENGVVDFGGGEPATGDPDCTSDTIPYAACWHAPSTHTKDACATYVSGLPPAGCFWPIGLWTTSTAQHNLGGQAAFDISGTFFTPNARPFNLGGQAEQDFRRAQFFTGRLEMSGQAPVTLAPNPDTNIPIQLPGLGLIR